MPIEAVTPIIQQDNIKIQSTKTKSKNDKSKVSKQKIIASSLTGLGIIALGILAIKNKKTLPKQNTGQKIEKIIGKNPKTSNLTDQEKEKIIKELQEETDNPDVKAEIRKLIENGEWDKL